MLATEYHFSKGQMMNGVTCERCGAEMNERGYRKHYGVCSKLPKPDDLLAEYENGDWSIKALADAYGVSHTLIAKRMSLSARYDDVVREKKPQAWALKMTNKLRAKKKRCKCGMLLSHPEAQPVGDDGRCALCHAPVYRDLVPYSWEDGKRMIVEYA